jgi:hypothetical protein
MGLSSAEFTTTAASGTFVRPHCPAMECLMAINIPSMPIRAKSGRGGVIQGANGRTGHAGARMGANQSARWNDCNLFDDERLVQILASPQFEAPRYVSTVAAQRQRDGHGGGESAGIEAKLSCSTFRWADDGRQKISPKGSVWIF